MTINDLIEDGIVISSARRVTTVSEYGPDAEEIVLYEDDEEWGESTLEYEWADWDISFIHADPPGILEIELYNPNAE